MRFSRSDRLIARASPAGFAHISSRGMYVPFRHLLALDEQLSALCLGELDRLIVSMPPRHGKSETISRYLPAWYLGRFPDRRVMLCSYEASFAASWGRKARELVEEFGDELFGVRVSETSSSASAWEIERHAGGMVTAGVGGPLTGKGAHLLVMDDPIKNAEEAASELMREKAWEWWRSTARTRLQRPGKVVLVMTRWHEDDLAGRLLAAMAEDPAADQWRLLELPALADESDPLGRPPGEPLCPELGFDADWAKRTRASSGSYWWSALYQQRPSPPEGMLFKQHDFRYWHPDSDAELLVLETDTGPKPIGRAWCTIFQTVDPAASEKDTADYTVVCTWAATPDRELLLLDRQRERFETLEVTGLIRRAHQRWNPAFIGIESFGHGLGVIQELSREGLPIRELRSDKDKIARARRRRPLRATPRLPPPRPRMRLGQATMGTRTIGLPPRRPRRPSRHRRLRSPRAPQPRGYGSTPAHAAHYNRLRGHPRPAALNEHDVPNPRRGGASGHPLVYSSTLMEPAPSDEPNVGRARHIATG